MRTLISEKFFAGISNASYFGNAKFNNLLK